MNWNKRFSVNVSMIFLLILTIISASVYYVANAAMNKLENEQYNAAVQQLLK